jgi:hypothetical protein
MSAAACRARNALTLQYTDAQLGAYLQNLQDTGLLEHIIVCVTGDHGQQFDDDYGPVKLGGYMRDAAFHVPLLLLAPQYLQDTGRIDTLSSHIDIMPTLMDLCAIDGPHHSMGESLARNVRRDSVHMSHPYAPAVWAARHGRWRYNYYPDSRTSSLFDLDQDPTEAHDCAAAWPKLVDQLKAEVCCVQQLAQHLHTEDLWAPSRPPYRQAALPFALPQSLEAAAQLAADPAYADAPHMPRCRAIIEATHALALPELERLELLRLRLQQLYAVQLGYLSAQQHDRLIRLEERAFGMQERAGDTGALRTYWLQLPENLQDVQRLLLRPDDPENPDVHAVRRMVTQYLDAPLSDAEKLEAIVLRLRYGLGAYLGALRGGEKARLDALDAHIERELFRRWRRAQRQKPRDGS